MQHKHTHCNTHTHWILAQAHRHVLYDSTSHTLQHTRTRCNTHTHWILAQAHRCGLHDATTIYALCSIIALHFTRTHMHYTTHTEGALICPLEYHTASCTLQHIRAHCNTYTHWIVVQAHRCSLSMTPLHYTHCNTHTVHSAQ